MHPKVLIKPENMEFPMCRNRTQGRCKKWKDCYKKICISDVSGFSTALKQFSIFNFPFSINSTGGVKWSP